MANMNYLFDRFTGELKNLSQPGEITRRKLLKYVGAATAAGVVANGGTAGASSVAGPTTETYETIRVWQLAPRWQKPRGPHGKTELTSNASRAAAKHRYALSSIDATAMNLHLCSWAPPVPLIVRKDAFMKVWNSSSYQWYSPWAKTQVRILDDRALKEVGGGMTSAEYFSTALNTPQDGKVGTITVTRKTKTPVGGATGAPAPQGESDAQPAVRRLANDGVGASGALPATLAFTGTNSATIGVAAVGSLVAGVAILRSCTVAESTPDNETRIVGIDPGDEDPR